MESDDIKTIEAEAREAIELIVRCCHLCRGELAELVKRVEECRDAGGLSLITAYGLVRENQTTPKGQVAAMIAKREGLV